MDVSPWLEFGWPIALLVLVLSSIGIGLGWFLKSYLKQQQEEYEAKRADAARKDAILTEQQGFIRELALTSLQESKEAISQLAEIRNFMQEMTRSYAIINEQLHDHSEASRGHAEQLKAQNQMIHDRVLQLERTTLTNMSRKGAD